MQKFSEIKLYGSSDCHKTKYYQDLLKKEELPYQFFDVVLNKPAADELRNLYENRKLNFPTITIGNKKLRNPSDKELFKWLNKLVPSRIEIVNDISKNQFRFTINDETSKITYQLSNGVYLLNHTEVPKKLRGTGIAKIFVEKTFEKISNKNLKAVAVCSYLKSFVQRNDKWKTVIKI